MKQFLGSEVGNWGHLMSEQGSTPSADDVLATGDKELSLWSDDPSTLDLLAFSAIASTVAEAVLDESLDPVALGLSGEWGSGKTTVLRLIAEELEAWASGESKILVVATEPWRYDPALGVKETLITEILGALRDELEINKSGKAKALERLGRLAQRVDWARAIRLAARASITLQLPNFEDVLNLVRPQGEGEDKGPPGLEGFRDEFAALMAAPELAHLRRVVVLVDDLDRCLPETVVETLEGIRLFVAVPKMSFVIAADENRVADAIRTRFRETERPAEAGGSPEEPAKLYLHKIVQTTVPLPSLSRFDTEAYLVLLQLMAQLGTEELSPYVDRCGELRRASGSLDDLAGAGAKDVGPELLFAARLTPILYEKLRGNPRRIKRFLNDLHVRQAIAARRGIRLDSEVVAKLMVLEVLLEQDFKRVLGWLAQNELRERMSALESAAGRIEASPQLSSDDSEEPETTDSENNGEVSADSGATFGDELIRWAKLSPSLSGMDLGPYLHLAAAFSGEALLDTELPVRLRDLAANLLSSVRAEQKSVRDADLQGLDPKDAAAMVHHLGRAARDRPTQQRAAILGLLRVTRIHAATITEAAKLLSAIPASDVEPASVLTFNESDRATFRDVLEGWHQSASPGPTKNALASALKSESPG
jgi:KAP family P-loop domain